MGNSVGMDRRKEDWAVLIDHRYDKEKAMKLWGIVVFGLIGAIATTFAVGQLRRNTDRFTQQLNQKQSWQQRGSRGSFRSSFQEEVWKKYQRKMQEETEQEMERERIRRMQRLFNREREKYRKSYQHWHESGPGFYHQHFQWEDWYWKTDESFRDGGTYHRGNHKGNNAIYPLSHHYAVLGLDRSPSKPYTEKEIKTAFREKAMKYHPDQNQDNKEAAEAKFKEVMMSYEAIKTERKIEIL